jgi:hypothetical protein
MIRGSFYWSQVDNQIKILPARLNQGGQQAQVERNRVVLR